ncbi:glycosyltransferase family 2 protein, partial [Flavobacteriaceae bacterium]|nr:glycosyltransferase family 2 protein [Flavobacteriaceae bacterium]
KLAIIIVNWKQYDLTKKCLLSISKTKFNNYKIILVDNESSEKKLNVFLNDFNNLKVIQNKLNLGFGVANNQAITYALDKNYDYVMLLNNDTEVDQNFIIPLIDCFEKNNSIGGVQPLIMNYNKRDSIWSAGGYINKFFGNTTTNKSLEKKLDLDWITGCCMLLKTEVIKKAKLLDENFFAYYEDVDWSLRIKDLGYSLQLVETSLIYHHGSISSNNSTSEGKLSAYVHYLNFKNHIYLLRKHIEKFNFFGVVLYQLMKLISYSMYFILRFRFNKLKMIYKGLIDGMKIKTS